jgi:ATP-dependent helicase/nuclease subunit B
MTDRVLFTGPSHRTLEAAAFRWVDERTDDGLGRVLYLVGNANRRDRVHDRWAETYPRLTLRPETLTSLVYACYDTINGPSDPLPDQVSRRALEFGLDDVVAERDWLGTDPYASTDLASAFEQRFARFENVGLDTPARVHAEFEGSPLDDRIRETTVDAYNGFASHRQSLSKSWEYTRSEAFATVSAAELSDVLPHVECVLLSGFMEFGAIERDVVEALVDTFPTAVVLPTFSKSGTAGVDIATDSARTLYDELGFESRTVNPRDGTPALQRVSQDLFRNRDPVDHSVPGALSWRELPTPEREVRYVARDIRVDLDNGVDPADIGVVIPGLSAYEGYVQDTFDIYDLPFALGTGTPLTETHVGNAVVSTLSLADEAPRAADLTALVTNPVVDAVDPETADAVVSAERRVDSIRPDAVLDDLSAGQASELRVLLDDLTTLQTESITSAAEALQRQLDAFCIEESLDTDESQVDIATERAALRSVHQVLDSFDRAEDTYDVPTAITPVTALLRSLNSVSVDRYADTTDQITVVDHLDAAAFTFERLYVVGLTTDYFPVVAQYPAFFERMTDEHPILEVVDDRLRDRYVFATLLANADAVTLTTPSTDTESAAVVRSPVLDELQRVTGLEPETGIDDRIGSQEDLQRAISPRADRREVLDAAGERGDITAEQTIRADRGIRCATARADHRLSPHDGLLDPETVAAVYGPAQREPYSASRIERYVSCGFRFYMEHVLDMADPDDVERTPDPLETGTYVHDTLERFYADLQDAPGDPVDLRAHDRVALERHLLDVALDELANADLSYSGLFYRRWLEQLFAGLADPDSNPHDSAARPHDGVDRGLFVRFVDRERRRDDDVSPAFFEAPFGEGLTDTAEDTPFAVDLPDGGSVPLRGYIDRVDIGEVAEGTALQLYDYKTGYAPSMTTTTGGTKFQLPIYLLAAESVLDVGPVSDVSATYYQVKPPNRLREPRGIESKFDSHADLRRFLDEHIPRRLGTLTAAVEHGRFHTTVLNPREAGCAYCSYRRSCDVRHHQRRERVAHLDDDPKTYVPVRATSRDFSDEFRGDGDD